MCARRTERPPNRYSNICLTESSKIHSSVRATRAGALDKMLAPRPSVNHRSSKDAATRLAHRHRHRLDLRVVPQGVFAQLATDAGHLETAERRGCVEDVVAVDPHRAGLQLRRHAVGLA